MARRQVPPGGHVGLPAPTFRDDLLAYQEPELDPDAGETDAVAACLCARRHVVIARELAPSHSRAVVDGGERRSSRVGREIDAARAGVERVGDDLREDRLLEPAGVGVAQVFEEVDEVDAGLTHRESPRDCPCPDEGAWPKTPASQVTSGSRRARTSWTTASGARPTSAACLPVERANLIREDHARHREA